MKKTHIWDTYEVIEVKCPFCKKYFEEEHCCLDVGDKLNCLYCEKEFELGEQRD